MELKHERCAGPDVHKETVVACVRLEDANIKLDSVISDIVGVSGRRIPRAVIAAQVSEEFLAGLGHSRLRATKRELAEAYRGFSPRVELDEVEHIEGVIAQWEAQAAKLLKPFRGAVELLMEIPGVGEPAAQAIISEIGLDRSRFPSDAHLISWAGLCPRSDEIAGKNRSTRIRDGAPWLSATRAKGSYLRAYFYRLRGRRGPLKAMVAIARTILQSVFHMLRTQEAHRELGEQYLDNLNQARTVKHLVNRIQRLGYAVNIAALSTTEQVGSFS